MLGFYFSTQQCSLYLPNSAKRKPFTYEHVLYIYIFSHPSTHSSFFSLSLSLFLSLHTNRHTHTHAHPRTHTNTHTHTHTHTNTQGKKTLSHCQSLIEETACL